MEIFFLKVNCEEVHRKKFQEKCLRILTLITGATLLLNLDLNFTPEYHR